ncbi:kinesin-like protein KIN-7K, chloroplastic [Ananas comosus]|uniref:Kinesin-like protein KIN-7K, chloroplastic n=1 Tax=Ananas comosus TaxID=4615 RepID=A0A6P5FDB4_ANACO|nr:kinesin-like protein KIN-7K, chloroplastic [Ananas comosus]XP_020094232.1 kinesin-like protein KIN-7K, chloroplastic [Ananas comosus]
MAGPSSSRGRSSSPFGYRKPPPSSYSSSSSSSSFYNGRLIPRSSPSSVSSHYYGNGGGVPRSTTPSRALSDPPRGRSTAVAAAAVLPPADELVIEDTSRNGDSISVTIRFRPLSEREINRGDEIAWYADGDKLVRSEYNPSTAYAFDRVFGPSTATRVVYDVAARPVVKAAMEGINGTVFAYGVTSSGKTHTMHGDQRCPGIIPLAIKDVFSIIQDTPGREFLLRVSYLEIYNEVINDLLDPTGQNLRVREDVQGTYVEGIKEEVVLSPGHVLSFIAAGEEHRHVGSNNFNLFSSRSHTIFTLMIESSAHGDEYDGVMYSQLNLIDLAGSESSKTETTGLRRKEGSYINKSLLTLGTVIGKLSEGKASHIPYRDSKLTRLLQSSLSGHGHVSLICTVTPASSSMEETHNTLKFASRAKRVEIYASRNRIIDEKSLIKKYQKEISSLREELNQLKRGMLGGINQEEIINLRQQLEEGQVKMQSRLEEEEEAKAALMSRIQRLTKLILVSTKNTIPGLTDAPNHQRRHSIEEESLHESAPPLLIEDECSLKDSLSSALSDPSNQLFDVRHFTSSKLDEQQSSISSSLTQSLQGRITASDQMDLLVEQVKMLAGDIAFNTSTLKRLVEQSVNDPDGSKIQIQNLELEIQEKRRQLRVLEQRIMESGEASLANASLVDMQQTVMRLMTQCNEKGFELELKSADNRILQEQLQQKCLENEELQEKILLLEQQLNSKKDGTSLEQFVSNEISELKFKLQSQEAESEKLNNKQLKLVEDNRELLSQNQKLAEESSYAKELASAAAVELKNLAEEVTKLSLENARLEKELVVAQDMTHSRAGNNKLGRKSRPASRGREAGSSIHDDTESFSLDLEDMKMELQARKQREAVLEATLAEKELLEEEYKRKFDEAKKRELALENDLAGMWVLVAKLKRGAFGISELKVNEQSCNGADVTHDEKENRDENGELVLEEKHVSDNFMKPANAQEHKSPELEPLLVRLKAKIQEMKEKELDSLCEKDTNSPVCKVCFESPTAAVLLPCRHFCLCKPCSLACSECPLCRTRIDDRIITFT